MRASGTLICIASAIAFGAMAIFGKLAYDHGSTVGTVLAVRFTLAALLFWALVLLTGGARHLRALSRRDVALAVALGAVGYAAQAGAYFAALERLDASLLSLVLYTFPAMVAVAAIVLGRERASGRRTTALALASLGLVLILAAAGPGALNPVGVALGLTAAATYAAYILVSEGVAARARPDVLSALVCTGAAVTLTVAAALAGDLRPGAVSAGGWASLAGIAAVSTVAAISLFFAGLRRVGATTAAILSMVEPLVTVTLAYLVFAERLSAVQLGGGALVMASVVALHARLPRSVVDPQQLVVRGQRQEVLEVL